MKKYHLRSAVTLGTGLTALFLLVHCTVDERDYSPLGIGQTAGTGGGGSGGDGGDGAGGTSAGQGGLAGVGGLGGLGGLGGTGGTPIEPIPCDEVINDAGTGDAGLTDAGTSDAGTSDAGIEAEPCACVDGFLEAIDADGDGAGTRACVLAPGLDCDDGDGSVTHNSCGGCTDLPSTIGEDCLDCGAYACDGTDAVVCASKPDPLVDPDCQCVEGVIAARDTDQDGEGTRLCEANPGIDCNDGNGAFVNNVCGGCESLPGAIGAACNECGVYACNGTAMVCVPSTGAAGRRCLNATTRQTCVGTGFWSGDTACAPNVCYQGRCEICTPTPATYRCGTPVSGSAILYRCVTDASLGSSSTGIGWTSWDSCTTGCNANAGTCTGSLLLPRDQTFDVIPLLERGGLPWHDVLNTANDADYG